MNAPELLDRLSRLAKRLEMEGRYTDQTLITEAVAAIKRLGADNLVMHQRLARWTNDA